MKTGLYPVAEGVVVSSQHSVAWRGSSEGLE